MASDRSAPVATGEPEIAAAGPCYAELEPGRSYLWCSCGRSRRQPYCDQSHKGTGFVPLRHVAGAEVEEVLFCQCKHTRTPPFCDGAHNNLPGACAVDDPRAAHNAAVPVVMPDAEGRAMLDGGCYVATPGHSAATATGNTAWRKLIGAETGARHQAQFLFETARGRSPVFAFGERHVVLLVTAGNGVLSISGRRFALQPHMGVYLRPGEAFRVSNDEQQLLRIVITACPQADAPQVLRAMPANFDERLPLRTVALDAGQRQAMGNRFFQMLVDKRIGSDVVTQFIGEIPQSKALPHRHLYEESLVILHGSGYMWTETGKAAVAAGDIIFLPRKQLHSLECTDPEGMLLEGVIYPGDNPAINYYQAAPIEFPVKG